MSDPSPPDLPRGGESLLPPEWQALAPLIDAVLDAAPEHRAALIIELSPHDPARQRALAHLVAECERDTPLINAQAAERFGELANEQLLGVRRAEWADPRWSQAERPVPGHPATGRYNPLAAGMRHRVGGGGKR